MTKSDIQKNFDIGAKFTDYTIEHPNILDEVPKGAEIILIPENDKDIAKKNISLGNKISKIEKKTVMKAIQEGKSWRLELLKV